MKLLVVLIISIFSISVNAEKIDRSTLRQTLGNLKAIPLKNGNEEGIWFSKVDADKLLQILETTLPLALDIIDNQDKQIDTLQKSINIREKSISHYRDLISLNKQITNITLEQLNKTIAATSWYKSSEATYIYGVLTGVVIIVVSAIVVEKTIGEKK